MNERKWCLKEARDWIIHACMEERHRTPDAPCLFLTFPQPQSPDTPPDALVLEAFRLLEAERVVTGHVVEAHNTPPIGINKLCLTPQAVQAIEGSGSEKKGLIGFDDSV
jgi:hypothetical protein